MAIKPKGARGFVKRIERIAVVGEPSRFKLKLRRGMFQGRQAAQSWRKLRAVLPGIELVSPEPTSELLDEDELVIECGLYDGPKPWNGIGKKYLNKMLAAIPDRPVVYVDLGDEQCQVMVVLAYRPDRDAIRLLLAQLDGVIAITHMRPEWVYGGYALSLLAPARAHPDAIKCPKRDITRVLRFA